jgi:hypothetical protein
MEDSTLKEMHNFILLNIKNEIYDITGVTYNLIDAYNAVGYVTTVQMYFSERYDRLNFYIDLDKRLRKEYDYEVVYNRITARILNNLHKNYKAIPEFVGLRMVKNKKIGIEVRLNNKLTRDTINCWKEPNGGRYRFLEYGIGNFLARNENNILKTEENVKEYIRQIQEINDKYNYNKDNGIDVLAAYADYRNLYSAKFDHELELFDESKIYTYYLEGLYVD